MGATLNKVSNAIHVISLLLAGWLAAVAFQAGAALRPDHPRMFFNAETWPAVKARAEGPAAEECALAWRFTGDRAFLEKARRMLEVSIAAEQLMEPPFIALGEMLRDGLERPFINRAKW